MCVSLCVHVWKPVVDIECLLQSLSTLCFETGSLIEPGAHQFCNIDWSVSSRDLPIPALSTEITDVCHYAWLLCWCWSIWIQVLMLEWQALSHLPGHTHIHIHVCVYMYIHTHVCIYVCVYVGFFFETVLRCNTGLPWNPDILLLKPPKC